jgi:hypothetical protein
MLDGRKVFLNPMTVRLIVEDEDGNVQLVCLDTPTEATVVMETIEQVHKELGWNFEMYQSGQKDQRQAPVETLP